MGVAFNHGVDLSDIHAVAIFHQACIKFGTANQHNFIRARQAGKFITSAYHLVNIVEEFSFWRLEIRVSCQDEVWATWERKGQTLPCHTAHHDGLSESRFFEKFQISGKITFAKYAFT